MRCLPTTPRGRLTAQMPAYRYTQALVDTRETKKPRVAPLHRNLRISNQIPKIFSIY